MKKGLLILLILTLTNIYIFSQTVSTNTCVSTGTGSGNLVIFANYDGGILNIYCDVNIPNLNIGVCTYEPVTINILGPYVTNVTAVHYAGFVSTTHNHCGYSPSTTTIVGTLASADTSVLFAPTATSSNPFGNNSIICATSCDTTVNQGGCNTADQIRDYFITTMGASLYSYYTQYGCWDTNGYHISDGGNCFVSTITDTTITTFSTSASTVCAGTPVNFIDFSPGATSWSWTAPGSSSAASSSQNLSGVVYNTAGTYTVTLTTNDGTGTCSTTQTITVIPVPNLNVMASPNLICPGDTSTLSVNGANTYQWGGGPALNTYQVHPLTNTWYDVTGTDTSGCMNTDSVFVTVYPSPTTPTINYSGGILTASPSASSYQWYLNGNPIGGATGPNYTPTQNGVYTVVYTDGNGCTSSLSTPATVSDIGSGISELNNKLQIFPNPGTGIFQISVPGINAEAIIEVIDVLGQIVYSKNVMLNNSYILDLSQYAKGSYEIKMRIENRIIFGKLILQ